MGKSEQSVGTAAAGEQDRSLSRRAMLGGAMATGAAVAFGGLLPARAGAKAREPRIVVVGAGLAGMTCAYRLNQRNVRVQVYEARSGRVGGRCWSLRGWADGQVGEHGGEFVDTRHVQLRRLLRDLNLKLEDRERAARKVPDGVSRRWVLDDTTLVDAPFADFGPVEEALQAEYDRIGSYFYDQATPEAIALDKEYTARSWLTDVVGLGAGDTLLAAIDGYITGFFGIDLDQASVMNLFEGFIVPYNGADERYHIAGGNDQVPNRINEVLPAGTVRYDSPLERISRRPSGEYELVFGGSTGATVVADVVVLTLPFTALRRVDFAGAGFTALKQRAIRELAMGTNGKLFAQFDQRPYGFGWNGSLVERSTNPAGFKRSTWESSLPQGGDSALITVWTGGRTTSLYRQQIDQDGADPGHGIADPADVQAWIDEVAQWVGPAYAARWRRDGFQGRASGYLDTWERDPWVGGSYAAFTPGQYVDFWGAMGLREGNVFFGGEHTSTYSQGYLNGGVESGDRCAKEVFKSLGMGKAADAVDTSVPALAPTPVSMDEREQGARRGAR